MIVLYDKDECPFCYRVRLCMGAAGLDYERRAHDDPVNAAQWRALTAANTVPVFVDGDLVLTDSPIILEYLADVSGQLLPETPRRRAKARELTRYADVPVGRALREVVFEKRDKPAANWDHDRIAAGTAGYLQALAPLDAELGDAPYFVDHYSFADAALTSRFALGLAYGVPLPESAPSLQRYFAARCADSFFLAASPARVVAHLGQESPA